MSVCMWNDVCGRENLASFCLCIINKLAVSVCCLIKKKKNGKIKNDETSESSNKK